MPCGNLARSRIANTYYVPPEVVDHVVKLVLSETDSFYAIAPFSLTCHTFRQIAFRRYFSALVVTTKRQWSHLCQIPGLYEWVRSLDIPTSALGEHYQNLLHFSRLTSLRVDFVTEGLHTHEGYAKLILSNLPINAHRALTPATKAKKSIVQHLTSLEFAFLPSITPHILSLLSVYCPKLQSLVLRCTDRLLIDCCWTCYAEASSCTVHSPLPDVICDVGDLTRIYGKALSPLASTLKHLHLGIHLSAADVFYDHIEHASVPPPVLTPLSPFAFLDHQPYSPSHCCECQTAGFLTEEVRNMELLASAQMKMWLPMLNRVCWSTWFRNKQDVLCECEDPLDLRDETTTCFVRWVGGHDEEDGHGNKDVEVRRTPW
ncbi:hypothetical protein BC835DRAFT_1261298 [Cytidiella melzeri]|nr:hypothetical protein BC835DRAFT_1261298 [Cytidiella melzeri]